MYKCNETFTSETGRLYNYGEKISASHYATLPYSEQNKFTYVGVSEESVSQSDDLKSVDDVLSIGAAFESVASSFSSDNSVSDSSSSSDFGGFDGGDSGGGGASGDF